MHTTIIGICGRKRHGKDTVGAILQGHGFQTVALADPIKQASMWWWGFDYEQTYGDRKEEVDPKWGFTPRHAFQFLGTEIGRGIHRDTWVRVTLDTIDRAAAGDPVVLVDHGAKRFKPVQFAPGSSLSWAITDVRFPNEAAAIRERGGLIVKVYRPEIGDPGDMHPSETEVDAVQEDYLIVNEGSLEDLTTSVGALPFLIRRSALLDMATPDWAGGSTPDDGA